MAKFNFSDFKSCKNEPPKADGTYLVLGIYNGKVTYCSRLEYYTEYGGWNVSKLMDGTWCTKNEIVFEDDDYFWATVTVAEDDTE